VIEFNTAYHYHVGKKHSKRLIVLMMLDSPTDFGDNTPDTVTLRQYLGQYTYIHYTADDWLDKLLYALPLRGLLQNNEDQNNDEVPLGDNIQLQ